MMNPTIVRRIFKRYMTINANTTTNTTTTNSTSNSDIHDTMMNRKLFKRYMTINANTTTTNDSTSNSDIHDAMMNRKLFKGHVFLKGVKNNGSTLRFYADTTIDECDGNHWALVLSGRRVRTPAAKLLSVPNALFAQAIALEWATQGVYIRPTLMPLTHIAITAIDQVMENREIVTNSWRSAAAHDNLCYRADAPRKLVNLQRKYWDPLLKWADSEYGIKLEVSTDLAPLEQDEKMIDKFDEYVQPLDAFKLAALDTVVSVTKSPVLSMAYLGCVDCSLDAARRACKETYHLCSKNELASGALLVGNNEGWLPAAGRHIWHAASVLTDNSEVDAQLPTGALCCVNEPPV